MSIILEHLSHTFEAGTAYEKKALVDINLTIEKGEFIGLIGRTGSGKSTLVQHLNGILMPTEGRALFDGVDIATVKNKKDIRRKVGIVFQYPEYQLFEATVRKDVAFGPKNLGLTEEEITARTEDALRTVGLAEEDWEASPFDLSGGQKRRAAIAGILAMGPDYLVLDEPTAGLDPAGRTAILEQIRKLREEKKIAVILVSHSMDDVAEYVDRVVAMEKGRIVLDAPVREAFAQEELLHSVGLSVPQVEQLGNRLGLPGTFLNMDELVEALEQSGLLERFRKGGAQ